MKYIIVSTQLCAFSPIPSPSDIWQMVFYFKGYNADSKKLEFDIGAKSALKLDSYEEAVDILNFQRNCIIQGFLSKNKHLLEPYASVAEYLKEFDSKMKFEIICVEDTEY